MCTRVGFFSSFSFSGALKHLNGHQVKRDQPTDRIKARKELEVVQGLKAGRITTRERSAGNKKSTELSPHHRGSPFGELPVVCLLLQPAAVSPVAARALCVSYSVVATPCVRLPCESSVPFFDSCALVSSSLSVTGERNENKASVFRPAAHVKKWRNLLPCCLSLKRRFPFTLRSCPEWRECTMLHHSHVCFGTCLLWPCSYPPATMPDPQTPDCPPASICGVSSAAAYISNALFQLLLQVFFVALELGNIAEHNLLPCFAAALPLAPAARMQRLPWIQVRFSVNM